MQMIKIFVSEREFKYWWMATWQTSMQPLNRSRPTVLNRNEEYCRIYCEARRDTALGVVATTCSRWTRAAASQKDTEDSERGIRAWAGEGVMRKKLIFFPLFPYYAFSTFLVKCLETFWKEKSIQKKRTCTRL